MRQVVADRARYAPMILDLAAQIAAFPQACLRNDRASALDQWSLDWEAATAQEMALGRISLKAGEGRAGARRFVDGQGRGGAF